MCGISGLIRHQRPVDEARHIVARFNAALAHRGPDDSGIFADEEIAFGHRRLSIIDLAGSRQPMTNDDGSIVVVFNGEIYNYRELRRELEARGRRFISSGDTEVLIRLYEELGDGMFDRLDGMFAFALCDKRRRRVLLVRDRLGIKPLLYFPCGDGLVFASEFGALRAHPEFPGELDPAAVAEFLSLQYVPQERSVYHAVHKLAAGHWLEYDLDRKSFVVRRYWHLAYAPKMENLSFDDAAHRLRELLERAVARRLVADVPLGVFLSGGIDSAIVSALAARQLGEAGCCAFTIGFGESAYDERSGARTTAQFINRSVAKLIHEEQLVDPCDFGLLEKLLEHYGEPFADASMLPCYCLSRFAREHITVALSGDGADEFFGGYERYVAMAYAARAHLLPDALRRRLFGTAAALLPDSGERSFCGRARRLLRLLAAPGSAGYASLLDRCPASRRERLFGPRLDAESTHGAETLFGELEALLSTTEPEERYSEIDVHSYLPGDILVKMDIASMACHLEVRSPFLDRELIEFAARLPWSFKQRGAERKRLLRAACRELVAPEIAQSPKKGFGVPVAAWLRGPWREPASAALFGGALVREGFFNGPELEKLWREHLDRRADHSYLLWSALVLALFLDRQQ